MLMAGAKKKFSMPKLKWDISPLGGISLSPNYFYQRNVYVEGKQYYNGYYFDLPVVECVYDNGVWCDTDGTTPLTPPSQKSYLRDVNTDKFYLYDNGYSTDEVDFNDMLLDYSLTDRLGVGAHVLCQNANDAVEESDESGYSHCLLLHPESNINIGKISGSGTLKLIVSGDVSGTITATWKKFNGITNLADISTIKYVSPNPKATAYMESGTGLQTIELSCENLVYTDIVITTNVTTKIYAIIWQPDSYFWDLAKIGFDKNVRAGNAFIFTKEQQTEIATSYRKKLYFNTSSNQDLVRIDVTKISSVNAIFSVYGSRFKANSVISTDALSCNGGELRFAIEFYNASAGSYTVKAVKDNSERTLLTKDYGGSSYSGQKLEKLNITEPLDNERIEISFNGGYYLLYWVEFIPDKSVTDCVKVASSDLTGATRTIEKTVELDTTFTYNLESSWQGQTYTDSATRSASGTLTPTTSVVSNATKGYVDLYVSSKVYLLPNTEVSITKEAGTELAYDATNEGRLTETEQSSGSQSGFAYLNGQDITIGDTQYPVQKSGNNYYVRYNNHNYTIKSADWSLTKTTTTISTASNYSFLKWTSDDEGLYDYEGATSAYGTRKADGTTMYAHFKERDQKVLNCAAACVSGESEGLGKPKVSTSKVLQGDEVIFSVDMVSGAEFIGWYRNENGNTLISSSQTYRLDPRTLDDIGSDFERTSLTLYAKMRHRSFTVQAGTVEGFENGTTEWTATNVTYGKVPSGEAATFTATADATSQFAGWYSDNAGTNFVSGDESYTMIIETTTTLYAKFVSKDESNRCTFNVNTVGQGTITTDNTYLAVGDTYPATINTYKGQAATFIATPASGYRFVGWTLDGTTITGTDRSLNVSLTSDSHELVANFINDGRNPYMWSGNPNDWLWGEQTTTNKIGNFTFKASSQSPTYFNADASSPISYNGTTYSYPYSLTLKPTYKGNYIGVEADRAGLLTILVRNTSDIARTINIYENISAYSSAASLSASLDVPTTIANGKYTTLTYNVTNAASFVIAADGPIDIYMIKYQTQHTITVTAENGSVTSKKVTSISEEEEDLTEQVKTDASYWYPTNNGYEKPDYGTIGTISNYTDVTVSVRNGSSTKSATLVQEKYSSTNHFTNGHPKKEETLTVLMQHIEGLDNGYYQVSLYANARSTKNALSNNGTKNVACVFANTTNMFIPAYNGSDITETGEYTLMAYVTDGTLDIGMKLTGSGTDWHTMQIKSIDNLSRWSEDVTQSTGYDYYDYSSDWTKAAQVGDGGMNSGTTTYKGVTVPERWRSTQEESTGDMIWREIYLPQGTYTVELYANSCNTLGNNTFEDGDETYAYVSANDVKQSIKSYNSGSTDYFQTPTLENVVVGSGNVLRLAIGKYKVGTNWHCIQIKSITPDYEETEPNNMWCRKAIPASGGFMNWGQVRSSTSNGEGGTTTVYRNDGTLVPMIERYIGDVKPTNDYGDVIWQNVDGLEEGSYTITLYAGSSYSYGNAGLTDKPEFTDGDENYAYVFANDTKRPIPSHTSPTMSTYEEITMTATVGSDGTLKFGIGKYKDGTNWHCVQVKSLYYNTGKKLVNCEETYHMTATPNEGYRFTGWTLDNSSAGNGDQTLTFTVSQDHNIVANFTIDGRDPFLWEGEPLDWIYGSQTAAKTLGIYTFKSNASYATTFEKSSDADVNQFDNEEAFYNHRWVLGGQSQTGSRYLLVEPTETGTLQMLVRDPSATPSDSLKFYNNTLTFKSLNSAANQPVAITNSNGDYQLVEYEVSSLNPFVVEATASVEIYAMRFKGEGIMTIPTNGAIPDGVTLTEATIGNVTDPASTMYGSNVVTYSGAKESELSVPHYVKVTAIKLHGTSASTSPSRVTIAEATTGTRSQSIVQDQSTKLSDVKYTIANPDYGQTFNITTEENGFQGIMTLYGEIRDHFAEPAISYDYKTKLLTMSASEGADIYYTTDSEAGMTYANSRYVGTKYDSPIDLSSNHSGSMTFYAVASKDNGWESTGSTAKMPSVVVSYTVHFYPSTEGFYIVESGDVDNLREVVSLANDAAYEGNPVWVFLPWGQYDLGDEGITLSGNYVSLIGEDNKKTHIFSSNATQTLLVTGKNAYIQDLLIENMGSGSAVHDMGSNNVYHNDSIVADKKAFLTEGNWKQRCYVDSCSFEGSEDLVCGSGDIYFQGSYFNLGDDGKHLSAQKTDADNGRYAKGYVFNGCTAWGKGSYSIARPWAEEPSATWLDSRFTGTSLTQGFGAMRSSLNVHFHESNNTNGDGYSTIQIPHTVEECQPRSSDPIFMFDSDTLSWFAVENFFAEYTKGSTTLTAWRPDNIAKQMFITDATLNNNVVNFNSNGSTLYLIEGFTADGNVEFLFTTAKTFVPMKDFTSYESVTVRAANGRGGFGKPVKCNVIENSVDQQLLTTVTLNENGYASFSYPQQVQIVGATPCKAFYNPGTYEPSASGGVTVNGSSCTLSVVDNGKDIVPAETGVILFGSPKATVSIYSSSENISESSDWARKDDGSPLDDSSTPSNNTHNLLPNTEGARSCTSSDLLSAESGYVAIYALSGNTIKLMNVTNKIGQNKAFFGFKSTLGSNAASARILFIDHEVVGIDNIHSTDDTLEMMFDLPGRKTDIEKGLIVKGNKVIMVK